jgi:multidrug efflux pump subunit AcrA (membrane-fusion protein)
MSAPTPSEAAGQSRRRWWWTGGAILVAVVFSVAALSRPKAPAVQTAEVRRGSLLVPVQCDGTLEPPPGGELRASDSGAVAELLVRSGDRVRAGTPLLRLANDELAKEALDARSEVLRLESDRSGASADTTELERQERHASRVFEADKRLLASGAITRMTYEQDELAWEEARDKLRAARSRLTALEGSEAGAGSRIALARKTAEELERRVAAMTVRAPSDGLVYGLPRRVGEAVSAGQVVANVIDPAHRRLRARVDQPDLPQTAVGQRIVVTFDGLPRERWEGKVIFVDPGLRDVGGREVGEVLGEVADPRALLPSNAAVEVEIVTGEKAGALVVPRASLIRDGERRYVYVLDQGRARRREVQVGLLGLTEAEVLSGLGEKDTVILPGSVTLSEGLRVRPAGPKA